MSKKEYHLTADEQQLTTMLKALGHPARMQIVRYLRTHPQCITGDLVEVVPLAQATVSQHLKVLRDAGWITGTIEGPAVNYCINDEKLAWFKERVDDLL